MVAWQWLEWAWVPALAVGLAACFAESLTRRDVLTARGIERHSGLLGRRVTLVSYQSVQSITVHEPGSGSRFDVGTVDIRADGRVHRLVAVVAPYEVAAIIERARAEAKPSPRPTACSPREPDLR
jgi:hypothetical protein